MKPTATTTPPSALRPPHSLDPYERVCVGATLLSALLTGLAVLALAASVCGCVYRGAKITEGTDLAIGLTVPGTEGVLQFNALNYLSGFRLGVAENAALTVEYSTVATNTYFGVVKTETAKRIKAKVEPCETAAQSAEPCPCKSGGECKCAPGECRCATGATAPAAETPNLKPET